MNKKQLLVTSNAFILSRDLVVGSPTKRQFSYGTIPRFKQKDPLYADKLPVFDYGKIRLDNSRVYVFGSSIHGGLGLVSLLRPRGESNKVFMYMHRPVRHKLFSQMDLKDIAVGHGFTLVGVKRKDQNHPALFGCGLNDSSQLGYQSARQGFPLVQLIAPVPISLPIRNPKPEVLAVGAGRGHTAISIGGEGVMTLGDNSCGQCGRFVVEDENYVGSKFVHRITSIGDRPFAKDNDVISIASRYSITICLTRSGQVYAFGNNDKGQLGRGKDIVKTWDTSQAIGGDIKNEVITKITTNGSSVLALSERGEVFGWGDNETAHIDPSRVGCMLYEPVHVKLPPKIGKITDVSVGDMTTYVVNEHGNVYTWGHGSTLGLGPSKKYVKYPTIIPPPLFGRNEFCKDLKVTSIVAGFVHSAAITSIGDVYTWGKNLSGCLGLGDLATEHQTFPLKVALNGSAIKVALGVDHTVILTKGGF